MARMGPLTVVALGGAVLIALSAWLQFAYLAPQSDSNTTDSTARMEYSIERFASVGVDALGRRYRLDADRLVHRAGDDGARLHRVAMVQHDGDLVRRICADSGLLRDDGSEVLLRGDVRVREGDGAQARVQRMRIRLGGAAQ